MSYIQNASLSHALYCKWTKALLSYSFELNPYNPCVANKMGNSEQLTVCWHMDDLKSSHIDSKVNDEFYNGLKTHLGNSVMSKPHEAHCMTILA